MRPTSRVGGTGEPCEEYWRSTGRTTVANNESANSGYHLGAGAPVAARQKKTRKEDFVIYIQRYGYW